MLRSKNIEDKIPDITNLATNLATNNTPNTKIDEVKSEILSITNLATTTALNATINEVKNKITNITNLATTNAFTDIENKITTDHYHDKYITTQEFNKLTSENFTARLAQGNLTNESDIANFIKKADLNKK